MISCKVDIRCDHYDWASSPCPTLGKATLGMNPHKPREWVLELPEGWTRDDYEYEKRVLCPKHARRT